MTKLRRETKEFNKEYFKKLQKGSTVVGETLNKLQNEGYDNVDLFLILYTVKKVSEDIVRALVTEKSFKQVQEASEVLLDLLFNDHEGKEELDYDELVRAILKKL